MCWPFKKKKFSRAAVCNHKYKPFPWYLVISCYDTKEYSFCNTWMYTVKVKAPYVCVKCKARRDETLYTYESRQEELRNKRVDALHEQYAEKIRPSVEVEGLIKDEQLVDAEYLRLLDEFYHPEDTLGKIDLFSEMQKIKAEAVANGGLSTQVGG